MKFERILTLCIIYGSITLLGPRFKLGSSLVVAHRSSRILCLRSGIYSGQSRDFGFYRGSAISWILFHQNSSCHNPPFFHDIQFTFIPFIWCWRHRRLNHVMVRLIERHSALLLETLSLRSNKGRIDRR